MTDPSASPTVLALITAGLTEVRDAVSQLSRDLQGQLSRLPTDYVPRRELERRLDELTADLAALELAAKQAESERRSHRRWLLGLVVATGCSGAGVVAGVASHFA